MSMILSVGHSDAPRQALMLEPPTHGLEKSASLHRMTTDLGDRLRQLRKNRNLPQVDVASAVGVGRSTIAGLERGLDKPGRELLLRLAEFYGVSINDLFGQPDGPDVTERAKDQNEVALLAYWRSMDETAQRLVLLSLARGRDRG